eukprot:gene3558-16877_t
MSKKNPTDQFNVVLLKAMLLWTIVSLLVAVPADGQPFTCTYGYTNYAKRRNAATTTIITTTTPIVCSAGEFRVVPGNTCSPCPRGTWRPDVSHSITQCIPHSACDDHEFVVVEASGTNNIHCRTSEPCGKGEYESKPPVSGSDERVCTPLTVCVQGFEYVATAATATRDQLCARCGDGTATSLVGGCTSTTTGTTTTSTSTTSATTTTTTTTTNNDNDDNNTAAETSNDNATNATRMEVEDSNSNSNASSNSNSNSDSLSTGLLLGVVFTVLLLIVANAAGWFCWCKGRSDGRTPMPVAAQYANRASDLNEAMQDPYGAAPVAAAAAAAAAYRGDADDDVANYEEDDENGGSLALTDVEYVEPVPDQEAIYIEEGQQKSSQLFSCTTAVFTLK